ncbi:hypothetical protein AVEN_264921-1 [Araneus ventricosus]|uniref:Uncharacterized protein n=1 Tax=Araneus ventricosus TaxID=182803 RepID=A0A4Y2GZJ9_ARAVE|nr:hypothetical protein AVEN_264921-1 [Araneus ventricosus]
MQTAFETRLSPFKKSSIRFQQHNIRLHPGLVSIGVRNRGRIRFRASRYETQSHSRANPAPANVIVYVFWTRSHLFCTPVCRYDSSREKNLSIL